MYGSCDDENSTIKQWSCSYNVPLGIFHTTGSSPRVPIIPDAFLSVGVPRFKNNNKSRLSYVLWEENYIVPLFLLEIVSQTYGNEYDKKMIDYARLGVLYYVIYNPDYFKRDKHERFEVYRLLNGAYQRLQGNPVWMPEIGLGIGTEVSYNERWEREWLYWYDFQGNKFITQEEQVLQEKQRVQEQERRAEQLEQQAQQERQRAEKQERRAEQLEQEAQQQRLEAQQQRQRAEQFQQMLRSLGIDPEQL